PSFLFLCFLTFHSIAFPLFGIVSSFSYALSFSLSLSPYVLLLCSSFSYRGSMQRERVASNAPMAAPPQTPPLTALSGRAENNPHTHTHQYSHTTAHTH